MTICITGGTGFVGLALVKELLLQDKAIRVAGRRKPDDWLEECPLIEVGDLNASTNWAKALCEVTTVIHLASKVHEVYGPRTNSFDEYRRVIVDGTINLARQAARAGVKRFIYLSSIKVYGEFTILGNPFTEQDMPMPQDLYGICKYDAELGLREIIKNSGMELVVIRPPLVYGPRVRGNFLSMMNWLQQGIPLPLGCIKNNRRSFIFVDNLINLVVVCINHPAAANQLFLVSDDQDLSTVELLQQMSFALGRPCKLISVPFRLLNLGAKCIGRNDIFQRLCGSLQVDIHKAKDLLSWSPPVTLDKGMAQTAEHFLKIRA